MTAGGGSGEDDPELVALLQAVYDAYHYDFRSYARGSLVRGVERARSMLSTPTLGALRERVVRDPAAFRELLRHLTIQVSDLFRDPPYFRVLRETVVPHLGTYPSLRIWVAGCGTGEEAYSIAILLREAGLLDRSLVYATDIDEESLRIAKAGSYALERLPGFRDNYEKSGGTGSLSEHCSAMGPRAVMSPVLRNHILFSDHSLATDAVFAEVQLVSCRNVLIYFDRELQDRAIGLFRESLCPRGFLGLGSRETLAFSRHDAAFEPTAPEERVYRLA